VIDLAVRLPGECQQRFGFADALDAWPAVVRIGLCQARQIDVDGVGVHVDEPGGGERLSVDGHDSVELVGEVRYPR
jgi:hypothetical protein